MGTKSARRRDSLLVGLDIGTTKVCALVGEETEAGVELVGMGLAPSTGLRKGMVINMDSTATAIRAAVDEAEKRAGCDIHSVAVGLAGGHIKSLNSHGIISVRGGEITDQDIVRVLDAAQAVPIPMDREILHIIPQEYIIDKQDGIRDPRGMSGARLGVRVHIITGAVSSAQNVIKCCHRAGLNVEHLVVQQLASSQAVLTRDERDLGVILVDIGGGTADIAVFSGGAVVHTAVIALGGDHVTRDIAIGLGCAAPDAEALKRRYGVAVRKRVERDETFEIPGVGGRPARQASKRMLAEIIEPRVGEIFGLVAAELSRAGINTILPAGAVITGGCTELEGMAELAERALGVSVRVGVPRDLRGPFSDLAVPGYATSVGLVLYAASRARQADARTKLSEENFYRRAKSRLGEWIGNIF